MSNKTDREYYQERGEQERFAAEASNDRCAIRAHTKMAEEYEMRAEATAPTPKLGIVEEA